MPWLSARQTAPPPSIWVCKLCPLRYVNSMWWRLDERQSSTETAPRLHEGDAVPIDIHYVSDIQPWKCHNQDLASYVGVPCANIWCGHPSQRALIP